jgi:MFS family permease
MTRSVTFSNGVVSRDGSILAGMGQTLLLFALTTLPTPLYGDYAKAFGFSTLTLTLIYATYVAGTLSTLFVFGRLSDQLGRKKVAIIAIGMAAISALLFLSATSALSLFAARLATGMATGLSSGTAVAWLRELHGRGERETGLLRTVFINLIGLGVGPLLCGWLAESRPPFVLPYIVYGALLLPLLASVLMARETVREPKPLNRIELGMRLGVPRDKRAEFAGPGVITFVIYSLVGFYSALTPSLMTKTLHIGDRIQTGAMVFLLFLASGLTVYATRRMTSRAAMLWGAGLMLPALVLLVMAEQFASVPALAAGSAMGGISLGVAYRGTLEETAALAPGDKRAELISMLFVCGNLGLALPVIGVGVLTSLTSAKLADLAFACVIALLSLAGLGFGLRARAPSRASPRAPNGAHARSANAPQSS